MYRYQEIRWLHLELTDRCNAACPQCPRNLAGGAVNPRLALTELDLGAIREILPEDFVRRLGAVMLCGNYGDPIVARDTLPILQQLRAWNPGLHLSLHTNASAQGPDWWRELGHLLSRDGHVTFSIDGLEDTNALYRRNTRWDRILENATAYIEAGGRAHWSFIVFRHNEHQVEEARALAERLGFREFAVRKGNRFLDLGTGQAATSMVVRDRDGRELYEIAQPRDGRYRHEALDGAAELAAGARGLGSYYDGACIRCEAVRVKGLYVSAEALVFPCCWTGHLYPPEGEGPEIRQVRELLEASGGREGIDARRHPLREIVEGPFFAAVTRSWQIETLAAGKLQTCAAFCGEGLRPA